MSEEKTLTEWWEDAGYDSEEDYWDSYDSDDEYNDWAEDAYDNDYEFADWDDEDGDDCND